MITLLPESSDNVVGFLVRGKLTDEDYKKTLIPDLENVIRTGKKVHLLFRMEQFKGWTAHGAWDDFINWPKFMSLARMAIVVDEDWHEFATWLFTFAARIIHTEIRFYRADQMADAWGWLRQP